MFHLKVEGDKGRHVDTASVKQGKKLEYDQQEERGKSEEEGRLCNRKGHPYTSSNGLIKVGAREGP